MNFLAHLYLSGDNPHIMIGNFIADHIKGNDFKHFHKEIQQGIVLHREIDTFTDAHKVVRKSKRRLHERYKHYDGIIIDIFYDYFLAKNWQQYARIPLDIYANSVYRLLRTVITTLPEESQRFINYMIVHNLLYNYQFLEPIKQVLEQMNKRTKGESQMNLAIEDLKTMHREFEEDFTCFFADLQSFCFQKTKEINKTKDKN